MNRFKGIPGPWEYRIIQVHQFFFDKKNSSIKFMSKITAEVEANCNLILAAPDLLEALIAVIDDLKLRAEIYGNEKVLNISDSVLIKAEKAIAKALNEENV